MLLYALVMTASMFISVPPNLAEWGGLDPHTVAGTTGFRIRVAFLRKSNTPKWRRISGMIRTPCGAHRFPSEPGNPSCCTLHIGGVRWC